MKGESFKGRPKPPKGGTGAIKPKEERHQYDLLQSITRMNLKHPHKPEETATVVRVFRDQRKLQASYHIDDQPLWDAVKDVDPFYRDEIIKRLVDIPGVRRVEIYDAHGCGFVIEN